LKGEDETAIAEMEKALELNPNLSLALFGLGYAFAWSGRPQEALPLFQKVLRQSPRAPNRWHFENMIGTVHILLKEHTEAIEWLRKATRHRNSGWWPHVNLAVALVELDRMSDARVALREAEQLHPNLTRTTVAATMFRQMQPEIRQVYLDRLRKAGLPK
jgi:adenylate cyclase